MSEQRKAGGSKSWAAIGVLMGALLALPASGFEVFHSPDDDGTAGAPCVPIGGSGTLNLWIDNGASETQPAGAKCDGTGGSSAGDEICMFDLRIEMDPALSVVSFVPDPAADVISNTQASFIQFNGGDPFTGTVGPNRIGQVEIAASGEGDLMLASGQWVDTLLAANGVALSSLATASPDLDTDSLCDAINDPCPSFGNTLPLSDTNGDGVPNECQCGDASGDGNLSFLDALNIVQHVQGTTSVDATIADTNGDGNLSFLDALRVVQTVQGTIPNAFTLTCSRRPEGTAP